MGDYLWPTGRERIKLVGYNLPNHDLVLLDVFSLDLSAKNYIYFGAVKWYNKLDEQLVCSEIEILWKNRSNIIGEYITYHDNAWYSEYFKMQ